LVFSNGKLLIAKGSFWWLVVSGGKKELGPSGKAQRLTTKRLIDGCWLITIDHAPGTNMGDQWQTSDQRPI
jgi:hypothetical protein